MKEEIIAIVEDDANQRQHYAEALRNSGYQVLEFAERATALKAFDKSLPDLAILDIMLGEDVGAGFEICRYLKERDSQFPIIFLTSRGDELDKIYGLQLGAWDYQTKPVSLEFLVTRIKSLFQIKNNTSTSRSDQIKQIGHLSIDKASMIVSWKETLINLTPTEFDLLCAILDNPDGASIEDLISATHQGLVEDNTINTHILHIRKKFKKVDTEFSCIKTRYGFGYGWVC